VSKVKETFWCEYMLDQDDYPYPVSELLNHGPVEDGDPDEWFDYVGHYGFSEDDVPILLSLASDTNLDFENPNQQYAPIHACRALGQLGDAGADLYLVKLLDDCENDWLTESALVALTMLGPPSLTALKRYFEWPETSYWSQLNAAKGFLLFAQRYPQCRDECIQCLTQALSNYSQQTPEMNSFLIYNLVQLKAVEASKTIEQAFHSGQVNEDINGPWPAVQVALGLAQEADFTPAELLSVNEKICQEKRLGEQPKKAQKRTSEIRLAGGYSLLDHLKAR
jgi:hypothetical protein